MPQAARTLTDQELMSVFNDDRADLSLLTKEEHARLLVLTAEPNPKTANPADFTDAPPPQTLGRIVGSAAKAILPSTTVSDYIKGPIYAATHPIESAKLVGGAMYDASADQATKAKEAAGRVFTSPTLAGKSLALSETTGHALGTVPLIGTPAAQAGEQLASGDIAGGVGSGIGLVGSTLAPKAVKAVLPEAARGERVGAGALKKQEAIQTVATQVLNPSRDKYKPVAQRIAPDVIERGLQGGRDDLRMQASEGKASAMAAKENATAAGAADVSSRSIVQHLNETLEKMKSEGPNSLDVDPLMTAKYRTLSKLRDYVLQRGDTMTYEQADVIRQRWANIADQAGGYANRTGNEQLANTAWAAREGADALRRELAKAAPDIATINADYSFWANLADVLSPTKGKPVAAKANGGRAIGGIVGTTVGAGAGALAEGMTGGLVGATMGERLGEVLGRQLEQMVTSPKWKLASAQKKAALADAMMRGDRTAARKALNAVIDEMLPVATASSRIVGPTPPSGRISIVGVDAGRSSSDNQAQR